MSYAHASESAPVAAPRSGERLESLTRRAKRPELVGLVLLSAVLNLWALGSNGWANDYYCAAVRSMVASWHDFLFASLDRSGVMTVDKPPLALWVQALSVRVFGYHPLSILVPQALMGVATRRAAVRPRSPPLRPLRRVRRRARARAHADHRRDLPPQQPRRAARPLLRRGPLVRGSRALEDGRTRWLVAAGSASASAFETKMGVALVVVPGDRGSPGCGSRLPGARSHALRAAAGGRRARCCWSAVRGRRSSNYARRGSRPGSPGTSDNRSCR